MDYNTNKPKLKFREYGRNVQKLVEHAKTIEDFEERTVYVDQMIELMQRVTAPAKNLEEYKLKLWSHLMAISEHELEGVEIPDNVVVYEEGMKASERMPYPPVTGRFRHYGRNVRHMIDKAIEMEDPEMQEEFIRVIGSYMKMAFRTWNRDNVTDEIIREDLEAMSDGRLTLSEDINLDQMSQPPRRNHRNHRNNRNNRNNRNSRNNRNNRNHKRRK